MAYAWVFAHFTKEEVTCKCGCGMLPTANFMKKLERLRDVYGKPMTVTSAARCVAHNAKVGGAPSSKHVEGIAIDVSVSNQDKWDLAYLAMQYGFSVGVAKTFLHLDTRKSDERRIWQYGKD
jgi:zinc D-Ala-D-Ala carboxypeptidase